MTVRQIIKNSVNKRGFGIVEKYPLTLGGKGIVFTFFDYSYDKTLKGALVVDGGIAGTASSNARAAVSLPLPQAMENEFSIQTNSKEQGVIGGLALDAAATGHKEIFSGAEQAGRKLAETIRNNKSGGNAGIYANYFREATSSKNTGSVQYFMRDAVDKLFPGAGSALSIVNGTAINPHVALTFEGVGLKTYSMKWRLSPRSPAEANQLKKVVKTFKYHTLPEYQSVRGSALKAGSLSRGLLRYPSLIQPTFFGINEDHFWSFKPCMVQSISLDYAPEGIAIQAGGTPAFVDLLIALSEVMIHTRDDYNNEGDEDDG